MKELKIPVDTFQPRRDIRMKARDYKVEILGKQFYSKIGKVYDIYDTKKNKQYFLRFLKRHNLPNNYNKIIKMMDIKGSPDLFVIKQNGDWFFSEVKAFHNKFTKNQNLWLKKFNNFLKRNKDSKQRFRLLYIFPKMWIEEI